MDSSTAILIEGVSVRFRLPHEPVRNLKEYAIRRLRRRMTYSDFWALKDVSFEVKAGEAVGIVGHNGAGKSTLLKVICGLIRPHQGRVRVRGALAPLIELGTGFDPELTGRENILLNGLMLGRTRKDILARFDRIVEFAELGEFIDAPLRTYSSGMASRLGFSIATDTDPDILLLDEILATGDQTFRGKAAARITDYRARGGTMLLVSHGLDSISEMCQRVAWLDHGTIKMFGPTAEVLQAYSGKKK